MDQSSVIATLMMDWNAKSFKGEMPPAGFEDRRGKKKAPNNECISPELYGQVCRRH
jgi:hypothetical protein